MQQQTVTEVGASEITGLSVSWHRQARSKSKRPDAIEGPPYIKYGKAVRYNVEDLHVWMQKHRIDPSA